MPTEEQVRVVPFVDTPGMKDRTFLGIVALAVAVLVALVFGAGTASGQPPLETADIEWVEQTPKLVRHSTTYDGVRFDIVGHYLNYEMEGEELQYAEVPQGATGLAIYPDGSVTFTGVFSLAAVESDENDPAYWGDACTKIDAYEGGNTWESPDGYTLVVLKHGTTNSVYENVEKGAVLTTPDGKDISHLIVCRNSTASTTTTVPPSTTTTSQTGPSTSAPTTTTTPTPTSWPPAPTTTVPPTSSSTTTSTPLLSTSTDEPPTELPHTGSYDMAGLALGAIVLIAGGVGLLRRIREDEVRTGK